MGYRLLKCGEEIRRTLKAKSYIQHPVLGSEGIPRQALAVGGCRCWVYPAAGRAQGSLGIKDTARQPRKNNKHLRKESVGNYKVTFTMGHDSSSPTKFMSLGNNKEIIPKLPLLGSKKPRKTRFEQAKNLFRKNWLSWRWQSSGSKPCCPSQG